MNKKVSIQDWQSKTEPEARITKLKDVRTHLAYKAEHVVDLERELILAAEVYHADRSDHHTLVDSLLEAQLHLNEAASKQASRKRRPTRAITRPSSSCWPSRLSCEPTFLNPSESILRGGRIAAEAEVRRVRELQAYQD
jgi:hypothetical protein